jgi:hypothetical protein
MIRRFIILAVLVATAGLFTACKEDTITAQQEQPVAQAFDNPAESPAADDGDPLEPESALTPNALCYANNFTGEKFRVVSYSNKVIVANKEPINCRLKNDRLKGEVRRGGVGGIREFVGDVRAIRGNRITIYTGSLPKLCLPKKGEVLKIIWKPRRRRG